MAGTGLLLAAHGAEQEYSAFIWFLSVACKLPKYSDPTLYPTSIHVAELQQR